MQLVKKNWFTKILFKQNETVMRPVDVPFFADGSSLVSWGSATLLELPPPTSWSSQRQSVLVMKPLLTCGGHPAPFATDYEGCARTQAGRTCSNTQTGSRSTTRLPAHALGAGVRHHRTPRILVVPMQRPSSSRTRGLWGLGFAIKCLDAFVCFSLLENMLRMHENFLARLFWQSIIQMKV
jgi:hypothetical protein